MRVLTFRETQAVASAGRRLLQAASGSYQRRQVPHRVICGGGDAAPLVAAAESELADHDRLALQKGRGGEGARMMIGAERAGPEGAGNASRWRTARNRAGY
jgi:hypothetical protein